MKLSSTISSAVDNAFKMIGDLAVDVSLSKSTSTGFDFNNLDASVAAGSTTIISGIVSYKKRDKSDDVKLSVTLKSKDVSDFGDFDTLTIRGVTYTPEKPFMNDGYLTIVTVTRRP